MLKGYNFLVLVYCLTGLFSFSNEIQAQNYFARVQKIGMENGLSSYNVNDLFQDADGFIWISTDYGINKYDGIGFKTFNKEENGLAHNYVKGLLEDQNNMLWIISGDKGGDWHHNIFDKKKEKFYSLDEYLRVPPPFNPKYTNTYSNLGTITFCEETSPNANPSYFEFNGKEIIKLFTLDRKAFNLNDKIQEGIHKTGENEYACFWRAKDPRTSFVLYFEKNGRLIRSYQCDQGHPNMVATRSLQNTYCAFCLKEKNNQWHYNFHVNGQQTQKQDISTKANWGERVGISKTRIYILNKDSIKIYSKEGKLLSKLYLGLNLSEIYFGIMLVDKDENLWFNNQEYLYCISLIIQKFEVNLQHPNQPIRLRGIAQNTNKAIFTGGISNIHQIDKDNLSKPLNIKEHNFLGLHLTNTNLWVGTESFKLCKLNLANNQFEEYFISPYPKNEPSALIWMPFVSSDGQVWAGGNKGLYRLDEKKKLLIPFKGSEALNGSNVYAFHQNKSGTWLSTSSGLYLVDLNKEKILAQYNKNLSGENYLPATHIAHLHEDKEGIFWLATKGDGLIKWNPKTKDYSQFTQKKSGLSHNVLYAVYGDNLGYLWMSSQRGLMRFHKETAVVNCYLKEDGLPHNEFNTISHYQSPDGHLYFGGQNGLVHFDPSSFEDKKSSHPLLITNCFKEKTKGDSLKNFTNSFFENQEIQFLPNDKSITLKLAYLDYLNASNHIFSYQIPGAIDDWVYQKENEIKLSRLPYGNFELILRCKNANASAWVNYPSIIKIIVPKPFYLETWFILLVILLSIGIIYFIIHLRIKNLEKNKVELENIIVERTEKIEKDKEILEKQSIELKSLDELKNKFFANISHELRTPLTLILGPLSYIIDNPEEWEKEEVKQQLYVMQKNGKNLIGLVEEIMDLSKLESNKLELKEEPTRVRDLIESIYYLFEPQIKLNQVNFELEINLENEDLILWLDRRKIEKVINNFLSNAIKFTTKGGKIALGIIEQKETIQLIVSDTGKGVHTDDLPFIFERFYQSKQVNQKLYGGTGIGLALVSEFAKLMKGKVYAESSLGIGSTFYFEIPKILAKIEDIEETEKTEEGFEEDLIYQIDDDFTVLVVEDNKEMRDFICRLFQKQYKTVLVAANGAEGLDILNAQGDEVKLIVSDVMMPELDGLEMLKILKSNSKWKGIPVIMLTALAAERDKLQALTLGVDDYLTKPFSVTELLVRAQNLLYNYFQRLQITKEEDIDDLNIPSEISIPSNDWIKEIEEIILNSIHHKVLDVEGLASEMSISSRQLSRNLKSATGLTPSRFIREVQLQAARKDLEDGKVNSIKEVCFKYGFEQVSTFSKLFKKRYGKNASDYLKQ